jgi:hypothetical protein
MQSAQDSLGDDVPEALDRAPVRRILTEQNLRTPPIIIGGEFRKSPPKVLFVERDQSRSNIADMAYAAAGRYVDAAAPGFRIQAVVAT